MDYQIDFDPAHSVFRLTVTAEIITPELTEDIGNRLAGGLSNRSPFALMVDFSRVKSWTEPADSIRERAFRDPAVSGGRPHVVVASEPSVTL